MTVDDNTTNKHITPQGLTFEQAVAQVLNAPPTPEQQAKKAARQARKGQHTHSPHVELLYFSDCPNYQDALSVLRDVLAVQGIAVSAELVAVESQEDAERQQFYGSPTIRIDGRDVVPPDPLARPALACRIYRTAQGTPSPIPPVEAITAALRGH